MGHVRPPHAMALCVNSGVAVQTGYHIDPNLTSSLYSTTYFSSSLFRAGRFTELNEAEKNSIVWTNTMSAYTYWGDFIALMFRNSVTLSERARNIDRVYMMREPQTNVGILQARVRQSVALTLYNQAVERRIAVAMALHPRIGGKSELGKLGRDVLTKIVD